MMDMIEKIDKCDYCDKPAKYAWIRLGFFSTKFRFLCDEHRHLRGSLK